MRSLRQSDTCIMPGVLSCIWEPASVLKFLAGHVHTLIVSYNVSDWSDFQHPLWINGYSLADVTIMFSDASYQVTQIIRSSDTALVKGARVPHSRKMDKQC